MTCCTHCQDAGHIFDEKTAKKELKRYQKKGPAKSTRLLLEEIRRHGLSRARLMRTIVWEAVLYERRE